MYSEATAGLARIELQATTTRVRQQTINCSSLCMQENAEAPRQQITRQQLTRHDVTPRDAASMLDNERAQHCATTTNSDRGIPRRTTTLRRDPSGKTLRGKLHGSMEIAASVAENHRVDRRDNVAGKRRPRLGTRGPELGPLSMPDIPLPRGPHLRETCVPRSGDKPPESELPLQPWVAANRCFL